jgi:translation initiation factor IF-3
MIKPDGEHEILSAADAIKKANGMGLDLVEVAPQADPPVCRVLDYKKYVYEKKKKEKEAKKKQHTVDIKELRFRPQTDDHDYNFKMKHAEGFLKDGNKVKATVQFRGRDIIYSDKGRELLNRFAEDLSELGKMESRPTLEGKRMSVIIAPEK